MIFLVRYIAYLYAPRIDIPSQPPASNKYCRSEKKMNPPIFLPLLATLFLPITAFAAQPDWTNICPTPEVPYCKGVGKNAHNNSLKPPLLRGVRLGKILGVAWRPKGSVIGIAPAIPSAGIPQQIRTSPRNAYYYIIDDGSGRPFLRQCREVEAK